MKKSAWKWMLAACMLFGTMAPVALAVQEPVPPAKETRTVQEDRAIAGQVPLRQAALSIGAVVKWDKSANAAKVSYGDIVWTVRVNDAVSDVNGMELKLSAKPGLTEQKKLTVPWDSFKQALNVNADWKDNKVVVDASDWKTKASQFVVTWGQTAVNPQAEAELQPYLTEALKKATKQFPFSMTVMQVVPTLGQPVQFVSAAQQHNGVHNTVTVTFMTDKGIPLQVELRYTAEGLINEVFPIYMPAAGYQKPAYDKSGTYKEEAIVFGEEAFKLPGTLTLPADVKGTVPVVVLVHGSGQHDRDESHGASKIFRDLAIGLAQQGVATVRYEKRTREYPNHAAGARDFTVMEETVADAVYAAKWAAQDKRIDKANVYVLGHSQGGMLVPRILDHDKDKSIRGAIVAAGPAGPIEDLILEQLEGHVKRAKDGKQPQAVISQLEGQVAGFTQFLKTIKDEKYSVDNLPPNFPMAKWWMDFRNTYAAEVSKKQAIPLFVIQGDNDFQVDKSHLDVWKKELTQRNNVEYKLYPKLNHFFIPSEQPSTGAEYAIPGNVPLEVAEDVAKWIKAQK
ncbi:alpha/beta fold hydrolase [Paenibacillus sp. SC116]|uniref:alpha/beta hydrolase family protein n=1 Tax=Paenibacillus sp. SC116 TaxID=2968986 RepID=UPI00215AD246|nr:alpha/beta fold hydrolase [Paenibacillus sp. SC116]MCR8844092.1 alpha/beta fold hydrolase [Paenibacillus sp. SC116]